MEIVGAGTLRKLTTCWQLSTVCQFGARHLHKHLWKLPIPEFNPSQELHTIIAEAGVTAAAAAGKKLAELRQERGDRLTVGIVRREIRKWLHTSTEGRNVEAAVARLLAGED